MKVRALKAVLYKKDIYQVGEEFEIDEVSKEVWKSRGWIEEVKGMLPTLEESRKKK